MGLIDKKRQTVSHASNKDLNADAQKMEEAKARVKAAPGKTPAPSIGEQVIATMPEGQKMSTDLQRFLECEQMATAYVASKALPSDMNGGKCLMAIQYGAELGLSPVESVFKLFFINGRIDTYGEVILMMMLRHGYQTEVVERTPKKAHIKVTHPTSGQVHEEIFTWEDAERAKLPPLPGSKNYETDVWILYPQNMLYWKAVSNARRFFCPEVMRGVMMKEDTMGSVIDVTNNTNPGLTDAGRALMAEQDAAPETETPESPPNEPEVVKEVQTPDPEEEDSPQVHRVPTKPKSAKAEPAKKATAKKEPAKPPFSLSGKGKDELPY